jgi:hypothetical protein
LANETIPDTANPNYQMSFTWKSVKTATSGAIKYQLQVSWQTDFEPDYTWAQDYADPTLGGGAIVSYPSTSDQAIWSNSTNYWRVRACGSDGCSLWTSARKLLGMPATPAYVGEVPLDNTAVYAFHWTDDNSNPADKYNIQICNNATCSSKFKSATVSNSLEYDLLLPSNKAMWWRVQGVGVTTGGWMLTQVFHTVTTPGVPSLVSPASNAVVPAPTGIGFSWNLATGADGYEIQISTSSAFDNMTDPSSIDQKPFSASTTANWSYGTGYWRVRAQTGGYYGQWSSGRKFTTKPYMHGFVYDLDGNPLVGAAVSLAGTYSTTTSPTGEYWLPANLPTGTKILTVTDTNSPGYLPMTRSLSLSNGGNYYSTNVWLAPVDPVSTDYRFVLSWADPTYRDLDLHAWLPAATPEHIFWQNPGTLASFPFAQLTVNDITPDVEVLDVRQFQTGKTVIAVNQYYPFSGSWSATNVKVEVYQGTTPVWSCTSPGGSGHWWYVMDVTAASPGATPTFTCKNKNQSKAPAPYTDNNISGAITQMNGRPAQGVTMDYGVGSMTVDSPYTLTGLGPGTYNLTPNKGGTHWTFNPTSYSGVAIGTTDNNFTAIPDSSVTQGGAPAAVAVQGDYLYVGGGGKLYVLNVQDKTTIIQATAYWISNDAITDVVVQGDYAYVVEGYGGLNILDISDPSNPQFVGLYADNLQYKSVAISGHYAFLTSGTDLVVVDIQDPAKPTFVVDDYWSENAANRVMIDGNYAYMVGEQGLWVLDITDPTNPIIASTWESGSGNPVVDVVLYGDDLILAETGGLYVLNDDDPTHPYYVYSEDLPAGGTAYRIVVDFDCLNVADGANGLLFYDISQPWNDIPLWGTYTPPSGSVTADAVLDTYAYIINGASVRIVNGVDPTAPASAGSFTPVP